MTCYYSSPLVFVFVFICVARGSIEPLNYDRIHLVDAHADFGSFLFRGNQPELNNSFPYSVLKSYLAKRALEEGNVTLPDEFYLYDISLLSVNNTDEVAALKIEEDYMKQNPNLGYLMNWPLQGDLNSPSNFTASQRVELAKMLPYWQQDQLSAKVNFIRSLLTREIKVTDLPLVVYVHCGHGQDRTGEMTGAYELQYGLKNFQQIWSYDTGNYKWICI